MLDSVDTLIAFVLIMLVVSLLITIAVQMVASLLNLRGLNLLSGLDSTFAVIDPTIGDGRMNLARFVLKGGLLSDSFLPNSFFQKWQNWPRFRKFLNWLNHWRHTSAARPDEIFDAIHRVATGNEYKDSKNPTDQEKILVQNAKKLLTALGVQVESLPDALKTAADLGDAVKNALAALPNESLRTKAQEALDQVSSKLQVFETAAVRIGGSAAADIDAAYQKFHYWTCICEERAQQWLTMHTRILTIIFAFLFAFALQLDTVEIFELVSSNNAVRDKLVAQAGAAQAQAAKALGDDNIVLKDALADWTDQQTDPALKEALAKVQADVKPTNTREEVRDKVTTALNGKTPAGSFDLSVNDTATQKLDNQARHFKEVKADFDKTGFQLFPDGSRCRWGNGGAWHWWSGSKGHRCGILFSIALLSLGAPFWYNALKNLTSLRSSVAQNISKEEEQAQKQTDLGKPKPPPTIIPS